MLSRSASLHATQARGASSAIPTPPSSRCKKQKPSPLCAETKGSDEQLALVRLSSEQLKLLRSMTALALLSVSTPATLSLSSRPLSTKCGSLSGLPSTRHGSIASQFTRTRSRCAVRASASPALGAQGDGNVKEIQSRADWDSLMSQAGSQLVVVDVATRTCGPCKFIYPKVVQLSLDYSDVIFLKIFGDLNEETRSLMKEWGVRAVPMFRFYRGGQLVHSHTGAKEEELRKNLALHHSPSVAV